MTKGFGNWKLFHAINSLLFEQLIKRRTKSLFGISKGMKPFVREHHDRF